MYTVTDFSHFPRRLVTIIQVWAFNVVSTRPFEQVGYCAILADTYIPLSSIYIYIYIFNTTYRRRDGLLLAWIWFVGFVLVIAGLQKCV